MTDPTPWLPPLLTALIAAGTLIAGRQQRRADVASDITTAAAAVVSMLRTELETERRLSASNNARIVELEAEVRELRRELYRMKEGRR